MTTLRLSPIRLNTTIAAAMVVAFALLVSGGCSSTATSTADRDVSLVSLGTNQECCHAVLEC